MRTIYKVIPSESGKVIVQSNDGKLYSLESENGGFWWDELPPLPQDGSAFVPTVERLIDSGVNVLDQYKIMGDGSIAKQIATDDEWDKRILND